MRILLSSTSTLEVVLRLVLFLANLRVIGDVYFRQSRLTHTARIQIGLGVSFLLVFAGTILQQGRPGMITPVLLGIHLIAGWGSVLWRGIGSFCRSREGSRWAEPGDASIARALQLRTRLREAVPIVCVLLTLVVVVYADWPRWVPITSDPQQHAFFARKILDYRCIPKALVEMGGAPFGYPAGTGILGFLAFSFSGLLPAETVSLLNGLFLTLCSLALVEVAHRASLPLAYRCLLAFVPFMPGIGGFGAWPGQGGIGKIVAFWLIQSWFVQLFLHRDRGTSIVPVIVQLGLLLVLGAELNPTLFLLWIWLVLVTGFVWKPHGVLTARTTLIGFLVLGGSFALMLAADPFFQNALWGAGVPTPTLAHLPKGKIEVQFSGILRVPSNFWRHLVAFRANSPRHPLLLIPLLLCILLASRALLLQLDRKRISVGILLAFLPALLLTGLASFVSIPNGSGARLVEEYSTQVITLTWWVAASVLAVWSLPKIMAGFHLPMRWIWEGGFISVVAFSLVGFGILPHLRRHNDQAKSGVPQVNQPIPKGLKEATDAVARLWLENHDARVLFVNWEWTLTEPERWIMVEHYSSAVALVRHANPAFFFYKGNPDYTNENYYSKVCLNWDPDWLLQRGIRWVLLPPRHSIDARCASLRKAADKRLFTFKETAAVSR